MITVNNNIITFTSDNDNVPNLEYELLEYIEVKDKLVCAVWKTSKLPKIDNKLAYYYYEGVKHITKSEYHYFPLPGAAGMVLKPHIRARYGVKDVIPLLSHYNN